MKLINQKNNKPSKIIELWQLINHHNLSTPLLTYFLLSSLSGLYLILPVYLHSQAHFSTWDIAYAIAALGLGYWVSALLFGFRFFKNQNNFYTLHYFISTLFITLLLLILTIFMRISSSLDIIYIIADLFLIGLFHAWVNALVMNQLQSIDLNKLNYLSNLRYWLLNIGALGTLLFILTLKSSEGLFLFCAVLSGGAVLINLIFLNKNKNKNLNQNQFQRRSYTFYFSYFKNIINTQSIWGVLNLLIYSAYFCVLTAYAPYLIHYFGITQTIWTDLLIFHLICIVCFQLALKSHYSKSSLLKRLCWGILLLGIGFVLPLIWILIFKGERFEIIYLLFSVLIWSLGEMLISSVTLPINKLLTQKLDSNNLNKNQNKNHTQIVSGYYLGYYASKFTGPLLGAALFYLSSQYVLVLLFIFILCVLFLVFTIMKKLLIIEA